MAIPSKYENDFRIAPNKSVLMCIEGGSAGRKIAILNQDVCFGNKLCCFTPFIPIEKYLFYSDTFTSTAGTDKSRYQDIATFRHSVQSVGRLQGR